MKRNLLILLTVLLSNYYYSQTFIPVQSYSFTVYGPANFTFVAQQGTSYKLQMSGIWGDYSGAPHYDTRYDLTGVDWGYNYFISAPLWLKNLTPTPAGYNSTTHTYDLLFTGDGSTVTIGYVDNAYGDNYGAVNFDLFLVCPVNNHPATRDTAVCGTPAVTLTASGAANYTWYDAATGGSVVSTTSSLVIPSVLNTDTFFVSTAFFAGCESNRDTVIVTKNPIPAVSFDFAKSQLCENDQQFAMTGTPAGGVYSGAGVTGASFNPSAVAAGVYTVTYLYTSPQGCAASDTSQLRISVCTGLSETEQQNKMEIFPNPAAQFLSITVPQGFKVVNSKIHNMQGQQIQAKIDNGRIIVSELPAGIYFLEIETEAEILRSRFIKE